jgi:hypothetical protein
MIQLGTRPVSIVVVAPPPEIPEVELMVAQPAIDRHDESAAASLGVLWKHVGFEQYQLDYAMFGGGACLLNGATANTDILYQVYRTPSTSRNYVISLAASRAVEQRRVCLCFDPNATARDRAETFLIALTLYISGVGLSLIRNTVDIDEADTTFPTAADEVLLGRLAAARILDDERFAERLEEILGLSTAISNPSEIRDLIGRLADGRNF